MMSKRCTRERLNGVWWREHGVFTKGRKMEIGRRMEGARGCDFYFYFAPRERRGGGVAFIPWTWTERAVWGVGYLYIGIQLLKYLLDLAGEVCIAVCLRHGSGWPIQKTLSGESVAPVDSGILVCKFCPCNPKTHCLLDWTHRAHRQKSITIHWHDDNLYLIILYLGSASDFHLTVRVNVPVRLPAHVTGCISQPPPRLDAADAENESIYLFMSIQGKLKLWPRICGCVCLRRVPRIWSRSRIRRTRCTCTRLYRSSVEC